MSPSPRTVLLERFGIESRRANENHIIKFRVDCLLLLAIAC
jgi:hypothetical protein